MPPSCCSRVHSGFGERSGLNGVGPDICRNDCCYYCASSNCLCPTLTGTSSFAGTGIQQHSSGLLRIDGVDHSAKVRAPRRACSSRFLPQGLPRCAAHGATHWVRTYSPPRKRGSAGGAAALPQPAFRPTQDVPGTAFACAGKTHFSREGAPALHSLFGEAATAARLLSEAEAERFAPRLAKRFREARESSVASRNKQTGGRSFQPPKVRVCEEEWAMRRFLDVPVQGIDTDAPNEQKVFQKSIKRQWEPDTLSSSKQLARVLPHMQVTACAPVTAAAPPAPRIISSTGGGNLWHRVPPRKSHWDHSVSYAKFCEPTEARGSWRSEIAPPSKRTRTFQPRERQPNRSRRPTRYPRKHHHHYDLPRRVGPERPWRVNPANLDREENKVEVDSGFRATASLRSSLGSRIYSSRKPASYTLGEHYSPVGSQSAWRPCRSAASPTSRPRRQKTDARDVSESSRSEFSVRWRRWSRKRRRFQGQAAAEHKHQRDYYVDDADFSCRSWNRESRSLSRDVKDRGVSTNSSFPWVPGMALTSRYKVVSMLGEGTFGRVLLCHDLKYDRKVAIKIIQDVDRYTSAARIEAKIMEEVSDLDRRGDSNCAHLLDYFLFDRRAGRAIAWKDAVTHRRHRPHSMHRRSPKSSQRRSNRHEISSQVDRQSSPQRLRRSPSDVHSLSSPTSSRSTDVEYLPGVHMCLVMPKLGRSLFSFLSSNAYRGFYVSDIQRIAYECLKALRYLQRIQLVHTDLKPENILLVDSAYEYDIHPRSAYALRYWDGNASDEALAFEENFPPEPLRPRPCVRTRRPLSCRVNVVDFGSATFVEDISDSLISTRQYRAPEVILHCGWSLASDMWSLGCILLEMYTGALLFATHDHLEHLAMMEKIIENIPAYMLERAAANTEAAKYVRSGNAALAWPENALNEESVRLVHRCRVLEDLVLPQHWPFAAFLRTLLRVDPLCRAKPEEAMNHSFFRDVLPEI